MSTTGEHPTVKRSESEGKDLNAFRKGVNPAPLPAPTLADEPALPPVPEIMSAPTESIGSNSLIGTTIDKRFRIISRLGSGGMSEVFKAEHLILQKPLAIKMLHAREAAKENAVERFQQEARAISCLDHPNIVKIYSFGLSENNQLYLAMDFLEGPSLSDVLEDAGHLDWSRTIKLSLQIAEGLEHAHKHGIVHRDLKPSNVIVLNSGTDGENVKIVDFGIARLTTDSGKEKHLTTAGNTCGSPPYMSPEQCLGDAIDARSDIYSFGCMLYELLSGKQPFVGSTALEVMRMHVEQMPKSFKSLFPDNEIPPSLEGIVRKCMSKNPAHRYQNIAELEADLKEVLASPKQKGKSLTISLKHWIIFAGTMIVASAAVFAWIHFMMPSKVSKLNSSFAAVSANDPHKMDKLFALVEEMVAADRRAAKEDTHDREIVLLRMRELQLQLEDLPVSLYKCRYESGLARLYIKMDKQSDARKLANSTLLELESLVSAETAQAHPNKRLMEIALLEALRLCHYDPDKQDRMLGKYNILISIYVADGRLADAEHTASAAVALVKAQVPPSAVAEISVRQNLASVLTHEGKLKEAEEQLRQAWELCKRDWSPDSPFARNVAKALADCYKAQGKHAEAAAVTSL